MHHAFRKLNGLLGLGIRKTEAGNVSNWAQFFGYEKVQCGNATSPNKSKPEWHDYADKPD
jgi:hypothetical protein